MRIFKDKTGKEWVIDLPIGTVERVKANSKFNLYDIELSKTLFAEEGEFYELLWELVEPQALLHDVSVMTFGENLAAGCFYDAKRKFMEEWRDFFQSLQRQEAVLVLEKIMEMEDKAIKAIATRIKDQSMQRLDLKTEQIISKRLNEAFGNWEASLDSILDPSHGDNSRGLHKANAQPS